jgi:hypothetical protein
MLRMGRGSDQLRYAWRKDRGEKNIVIWRHLVYVDSSDAGEECAITRVMAMFIN